MSVCLGTCSVSSCLCFINGSVSCTYVIHEECQQLVLSLVLLNAENVIGATTVSDRVLQLQEVQQFGSGFGLDVHVGLDSMVSASMETEVSNAFFLPMAVAGSSGSVKPKVSRTKVDTPLVATSLRRGLRSDTDGYVEMPAQCSFPSQKIFSSSCGEAGGSSDQHHAEDGY